MPQQFAISDIHGCALTFQALLDQIAFSKADQLFLLGDYIDRGPDSKGVIDAILRMRADGYAITCLRGNHEQLFLDALEGRIDPDEWYHSLGRSMMVSYPGVTVPANLPAEHLHFIQNLALYHLEGPYILVHGGLDWDKGADPLGDPYSIMWARYWQDRINYDWLGDRYILHGHTPTPKSMIEAQFELFAEKRWLDIDAGCFVPPARQTGMGHLCAFDMNNRRLIFHPNIDY